MPSRGTDPETFEQSLTRLEDMLVKTVSTTVRETPATEEKPAEVVETIRLQLHSPLKGAAILARLAGMDPNSVDEG